MPYWNQEEAPEYIEGKTDYTNWEKGAMADEFLREDSKRELCRTCLEADAKDVQYGEPTGTIDTRPLLAKDGEPLVEDGEVVLADYKELACEKGHTWFDGEGKARGIDGKDPILFEEHIQNRRKREIYTQIGTPDPSIVAGIYNRIHPQGRKVNSADQRKRNGASFYR